MSTTQIREALAQFFSENMGAVVVHPGTDEETTRIDVSTPAWDDLCMAADLALLDAPTQTGATRSLAQPKGYPTVFPQAQEGTVEEVAKRCVEIDPTMTRWKTVGEEDDGNCHCSSHCVYCRKVDEAVAILTSFGDWRYTEGLRKMQGWFAGQTAAIPGTVLAKVYNNVQAELSRLIPEMTP